MGSSVLRILQQQPILLQDDSQAAELCSGHAVLQPNLPHAEGAGNLEGQGQNMNEEKAKVNYLVISWCMNLVSSLQHVWQVITDLELVSLP